MKNLAASTISLSPHVSLFSLELPPDAELRALPRKASSQTQTPRAQTERLLDDPNSRRFVDAFLDYWLDLRKITDTALDAALYPDY